MANRIEDYAAIGNCETMALVGRDGSIDWLGFPRFDSAACFAALLGDSENGRWLLAPIASRSRMSPGAIAAIRMILETTFETPTGSVRVIDFMSAARGCVGPGADRQGPSRQGGHAHRTDRALRIWLGGTLGFASG